MYINIVYILFFKYKTIQNGPKVIIVELVEVAEVVQEHHDHLWTILNRFIFEK